MLRSLLSLVTQKNVGSNARARTHTHTRTHARARARGLNHMPLLEESSGQKYEMLKCIREIIKLGKNCHSERGTLYCYLSVCFLSHWLVFWHCTSCSVWLTGNWIYFKVVFLTESDRLPDARKCHVALYTAVHSWSEDGNEATWGWCFGREEEQTDG